MSTNLESLFYVDNISDNIFQFLEIKFNQNQHGNDNYKDIEVDKDHKGPKITRGYKFRSREMFHLSCASRGLRSLLKERVYLHLKLSISTKFIVDEFFRQKIISSGRPLSVKLDTGLSALFTLCYKDRHETVNKTFAVLQSVSEVCFLIQTKQAADRFRRDVELCHKQILWQTLMNCESLVFNLSSNEKEEKNRSRTLSSYEKREKNRLRASFYSGLFSPSFCDLIRESKHLRNINFIGVDCEFDFALLETYGIPQALLSSISKKSLCIEWTEKEWDGRSNP